MIKRKNVKAPGFAPKAPKGLAPFPFQNHAFAFVSRRLETRRAAYLAADPGLGKTIVSCLLTNARTQLGSRKILYVCPPSLTANVDSEFKKWSPERRPRIVADTQLEKLDLSEFKIAFVDEAHRFNNAKTKRTAALFELLKDVPKIVFLSGSPLPNSRPIELWNILRNFAPDVFGTDFWTYARRYCGARKVVIGKTRDGKLKTRWKFDGRSNMAEFRKKLFASFMLRQKAEDVEGLPPLREGLLVVGPGITPTLAKIEKKILSTYSKDEIFGSRLAKKAGKESIALMEYARLIGPEKLKHFYPVLDHLLYDTKEKILLFTHHKDVAGDLAEYLHNFRPLVVTGETPKAKRKKLIDDFNADPDRRIGVMNLAVGQLGWNLQAVDRVILVEFSWRHGDNDQAIRRALRIGRENFVLAQYLVLKDSLDAKRMAVVLSKRHGAV
jgi:SNF2 family DNA or RNA helicase